MIKRNLSGYMQKLPLVLCFLFFALLSCGDEYFLDDVDCSECYTPKPETGPVTVTITINNENKRVPVKIYKGKYEENFLYDDSKAVIIDTITQSSYEAYLNVNEYYSVAAEYIQNGKKTIVVDGDKLKLYKVSDNCDDVCWIFRGGDIDVSLKK